MKSPDLTSFSIDELVTRFIDSALKREAAERHDRLAEETRHIWALWHIQQELKSRSGDLRGVLVRLFDHSNRQVRVEAALATAFVAPAESRRVLEDIVKSGGEPQASRARERIMNLDSGFYVPS